MTDDNLTTDPALVEVARLRAEVEELRRGQDALASAPIADTVEAADRLAARVAEARTERDRSRREGRRAHQLGHARRRVERLVATVEQVAADLGPALDALAAEAVRQGQYVDREVIEARLALAAVELGAVSGSVEDGMARLSEEAAERSEKAAEREQRAGARRAWREANTDDGQPRRVWLTGRSLGPAPPDRLADPLAPRRRRRR